jgi:ClpP class serine protease
MNLFLEVFQHAHWFIEPDSLNLLLNTLKSENAKDSFEENFKTFFKNPEDDKAISYEVVDGVASIPLYGPIFPKSNFMTWLGYATALTDLKNAFEKAKMDTSVDSVALICHSPGGVVFGVNAFSQYLKNYEKKVSTYVPGMCCSAAYWIASASDEIIVDETAMVGSIGVVCDVLNPEHDPYIEITNRKSPNKRPNPATEEGKGVIQDELDALADVFINAVAGNRNVSISVVENKFGKGGVLVGKDAVSAGMVDSIATFDEFASSLKKDK